MYSIYVIIFILIFYIIYFCLDNIIFKSKLVNIVGKQNGVRTPQFISNYFISINKTLENLNFPYNINLKKYICIKYILPVLVFVISYFNYNSLTVPIVLAILLFFLPNFLIRSYIKSQNIKIIKELKVINTNLILSLSSYVPFKDAIKGIVNCIEDKQIKKHFAKFAYEYETMNFDIRRPAENLLSKFKSSELTSFMNVLIQCVDDGNILNNLERFNSTLELSYFKYLNSQAAKRMMYVIIGTVMMLVNIIVISMYPIIVQVINNLETIFS